jgi:dCTP deaminase
MALTDRHLFPELVADTTVGKRHTTGIVPSQRIRQLISTEHLTASTPIMDEQIQPASVDLRLGDVAYRVRASFLPARTSIRKRLEKLCLHQMDLRSPTILERGCVYLVPVLEELNLPNDLWAEANPKSTTGRLDVFTRLITDFGVRFDYVPAGYKGKLYLEIVPQTFSIIVSAGARLSQLRFLRGTPVPSAAKLTELHENEVVVYDDDGPGTAVISKGGLWLSVDLTGTNTSGLIGYRAKQHAPAVDLSRVDYYDPSEFWEPMHAGSRGYVILEPDEFYILASRQRVSVPPAFAATMSGYEPALGEFRVHYAGFFDPGFGYGLQEVQGACAVLEVRSHQVPYVLEDGQRVAHLIYERLQCAPDRVYGLSIGSSYQAQGLALSKQFRRPR